MMLTKEMISFSGGIEEFDENLNFYMDIWFNPDEIFGTNVETSENDDYINLYANFNMARNEVCDTLDIVLCKGDGSMEDLSYFLSKKEKDLLREEMFEYMEKENFII